MAEQEGGSSTRRAPLLVEANGGWGRFLVQTLIVGLLIGAAVLLPRVNPGLAFAVVVVLAVAFFVVRRGGPSSHDVRALVEDRDRDRVRPDGGRRTFGQWFRSLPLLVRYLAVVLEFSISCGVFVGLASGSASRGIAVGFAFVPFWGLGSLPGIRRQAKSETWLSRPRR